MTLEVRSTIPGLPPEAQRALVEVQNAVRRECSRIEQSARRPKRNVTELHEGDVIAKPGEVVRVLPGDEDITVYLPEPDPANAGEDIIVNVEGDGTAVGRVLVEAVNGTCTTPAITTLNAPGAYRFTSTGAATESQSGEGGGSWGGDPPIVAEDLPDDSVSNDVLEDMPGNSVKVNTSASTGTPSDLVVGADSVVGRLGGNLGAVALADLDSTSIVYDATSHTFQRAALTGDVTASQNANGTTIANDAVTNAKLANMAEGTVKGRALAAGTGDPQDLTGTEVGALLRFAVLIDTTSTGTITSYAPTGITSATTTIRVTPAGNVTLRGMSLADGQEIAIRLGRTSAFTVTINHEDASASVDTERFNCPGNVALVLRAGEACIIRRTESRNNVIAAGRTSVADGDYGDITVSTNGTVWNIDASAVTEVELATSVAGAGLTGGGGTALAVGAGTGITVNANDVQLSTVAAETFFGNFTASTAAPSARAGSSVAGAGLTYTAGGTLAVGAGTGITVAADAVSVTIPLTDGDKGDITVATSGTVWTIDNAAVTTAKIADGNVTLAKLANQADDTFLANISGASGPPSAVALSTLAGAGLTGGADAVLAVGAGTGITVNANDVAVTIPLTDGDKGDITVATSGTVWTIDNAAVTTAKIADGNVTLAKLANQADDTFLANISGASGPPSAVALSTLAGAGLTGGADAVLAVGAGTGITVNANDVAVTTPLTDGDKGDITVSSNGTVWTIDNSAVTLAKMENRSAGTVIGRAIDAGTGAPTALTGAEVGSLARRYWWETTDTTTSGTVNGYALTDKQVQIHFNLASPATIRSFTVQTGKTLEIALESTSAAVTLPNEHASGTLGLIRTPGALDLVLSGGDAAILTYLNNRWRVVGVSRRGVADRDYGDVTVTAGGLTWTIDNDAVSDAKLRNSAALSVIGRSANSTGDPADIAAANDAEVLRRSGTTLGFGTVATAGIANSAVTLAKMADLAASRIIGQSEGAATGAPIALTPTQVVAIIDGESPTWTGAHTFNGTAITANVTTADILLGAAVGGVGLFSGQATANVTNGDLVLNSASGIAINATGTAVTSVAAGTIDISSTTEVEVNTVTLDVNVTTLLLDATNSSSIAVGGGDLTLAASGAVIVASPLEAGALVGTGPAVFEDAISMEGTVDLTTTQTSATATLNNLALGDVSVVRLSGTNFLLSGMVPSSGGGQLVLIANIHETEDATILCGSTSSTLGNRFAGEHTSRFVRAGEMVLAWYDGNSEVWRFVGGFRDVTS